MLETKRNVRDPYFEETHLPCVVLLLMPDGSCFCCSRDVPLMQIWSLRTIQEIEASIWADPYAQSGKPEENCEIVAFHWSPTTIVLSWEGGCAIGQTGFESNPETLCVSMHEEKQVLPYVSLPQGGYLLRARRSFAYLQSGSIDMLAQRVPLCACPFHFFIWIWSSHVNILSANDHVAPPESLIICEHSWQDLMTIKQLLGHI